MWTATLGRRNAARRTGSYSLQRIAIAVAVRALHLLPPETAHALVIRGLRSGVLPALPLPVRARLRASFCGIELPHPLGLAAGFDKNAEAVAPLMDQGFSWIEIGTVTPKPQTGNPGPRVFRLPSQQALINRMGFNNEGLKAVCARLGAEPRRGRVGANIGANRDSIDPIADYVECLRGLYPLVDYITVNVSSPNTPGLRDLQRPERLTMLLSELVAARAALAVGQRTKALLLKIAPDLAPEDEAEIARIALGHGIEGLIISNTTIDRSEIGTGPHACEAGGLSGPPLFRRSTEQLRRLFRLTAGRLPLVGVGGITTGAGAYAKIRAGASALQIHTAFLYEGPGVVARVLDELDRLLAADGYASLGEAVGVDSGAPLS